jgi:hypothetical protein
MSCLCQRVKDIPVCTNSIEVGTISEIETDVFVYIKNLTTDAEKVLEATSDDEGLVVVDVSTFNFSKNYVYEIKITDKDGNLLDIQLSQYNIVDCVTFDAKSISSTLDDFSSLLNVKLEI